MPSARSVGPARAFDVKDLGIREARRGELDSESPGVWE